MRRESAAKHFIQTGISGRESLQFAVEVRTRAEERFESRIDCESIFVNLVGMNTLKITAAAKLTHAQLAHGAPLVDGGVEVKDAVHHSFLRRGSMCARIG